MAAVLGELTTVPWRCGMGDVAFHVEKRVSGVHVPPLKAKAFSPSKAGGEHQVQQTAKV